MVTFILRRLILLVPTLWGALTLVFLLRPLIPGDPIDFMLGETARTADREVLRREFHLDLPVIEQYGLFLRNAVRADFGRSIHTRRPVMQMVAERFPATLELAAGGMTVVLFLAIPLGILSAIRKDSLVDDLSRVGALLGIAMPNFWLGPLLIMFFSIHLGWLPVAGKGGVQHLLLPSLTLGTAMCALLTRMTRAVMLERIHEDYVTAARARGVSEIKVILKHVFRNALIPLVTLLALQAGGLLAGSIITETVFAWPGIGTLLISAINSRDFPLLQGCIVVICVSYILINLCADLIYAAVNPTVRFSSKR